MWQVTAVNLRQVPGDWESDVLILQFGQLRPKAGISLLQGTQWGSDTMQIKAEVSELIAWVFPANCEVLTALLLLPPLECGTNWSECQWPACQHVFWSCIFPELATFSRKKKSFVLNNTRKQNVLCSLSDIQRHNSWMRPWPLHEHVHSHQRLLIFSDGVSQTWLPPHSQPLSEPKKSAYKNLMRYRVSYTLVMGCELGKAKQIFIAFVLWARPWTWAVGRKLREKIPRNRWTKRQVLHVWSKVRIHGCTHELFNLLKNEIKTSVWAWVWRQQEGGLDMNRYYFHNLQNKSIFFKQSENTEMRVQGRELWS